MNRRFLKTPVASVIAIVLVYYSVAWAVLRCPHAEDHTGSETAVSVADMHQRDFSLWPPNHPRADIECLDSSYHTETLAGPSARSQMKTLAADIASYVNTFLTLNDIAQAASENLGLTTLFDRGFASTFPIDSPRYLSLSVLRI
jgi:hypothetical protein